MNKNSMPKELRNCPHCHAINSMSYYKEDDLADLYYCDKCYGIGLYNGVNLLKWDGEAYHDRDKK